MPPWLCWSEITIKLKGRPVNIFPNFCHWDKVLWCHIRSHLAKVSRSLVLNSLWPGDAIWRHGTGSILAQVMACCLTAPIHYLSWCWLIIHHRVLSWENLNIPISKTRLKIAFSKLHQDLPGANELSVWSVVNLWKSLLGQVEMRSYLSQHTDNTASHTPTIHTVLSMMNEWQWHTRD